MTTTAQTRQDRLNRAERRKNADLLVTAPAPESLFAKQGTDAHDRNTARALDAGLEPCTHCGRGVKPGAGFLTVVLDGGATVKHPAAVTAADEADPGYMGAWVLGSTCAKGIPAAARAPWTGWNA